MQQDAIPIVETRADAHSGAGQGLLNEETSTREAVISDEMQNAGTALSETQIRSDKMDGSADRRNRVRERVGSEL